MKKLPILLLVLVICVASGVASAQAPQSPNANSQTARAKLEAMVAALGGQRWLSLQNSYTEGRVSGFYHGKPTGAIQNFYEWRTPSGQERVEFSKKHDDIEIFTGNYCWEATYRGKRALPKDICEDFHRRRDHSVDAAVRVWMNDPKTMLIDDGQSLSERHLTDQVTLINAENDSITIQMDAQTHLPRSLTFTYRDPEFQDKDTDREEYDNYHIVDGFPAPYSVTRFKNGDIVSQRYLFRAAYNVQLPPDTFDIDATVAKVKK
jgi:hypothetical protein